jgi:hypothetical protein
MNEQNPISFEAYVQIASAEANKPKVSEQDYNNLAQIAAAMHAKNELLKKFLNTNKEDLEITVMIGDKSYTFGSADYEFDNLCETIEGIDVDTEWGDCVL